MKRAISSIYLESLNKEDNNVPKFAKAVVVQVSYILTRMNSKMHGGKYNAMQACGLKYNGIQYN